MHDGYQNTYALVKNGREITLGPLAPQQTTKPNTKEEPKEGKFFFLSLTLLS